MGGREFILVQSPRLQSLTVAKSQWQELGTGSHSTSTVRGGSMKTACLLRFLSSLYSLGMALPTLGLHFSSLIKAIKTVHSIETCPQANLI